MRGRARGFTLLELLVAVAIFAVVSAFAYEGLSQALKARRRLDHERRFWQGLAITFSELKQDLAQARPRPVRDAAGLRQEIVRMQPSGRHAARVVFDRVDFNTLVACQPAATRDPCTPRLHQPQERTG